MRKFWLIAGGLLVCAMSYAQDYYMKFGAGYGVPFNRTTLVENWELRYSYSISTVYDEREVITTSFGEGYHFGASFGYRKWEHVGLELGGFYIQGREKDYLSRLIYYNDEDSFNNIFNSTTWGIVPRLLFVNELAGAPVYLAVSPTFAFPSFTHTFNARLWNGDDIIMREEYKPTFTVGFNTTLGVEIQIEDHMVLDFNVGFNSLNFTPKESEIMEYTWESVDSLAYLNTNEKQFVYEKNYKIAYDVDTNGDLQQKIDKDAPTPLPRQHFSFGAIRFGIGIKYLLK